MRLCDGCGTKIPRFQPRTNQGGQMLCNGCAEGKPGAPGRPIGLHGSKDDPAERIFAQLRQTAYNDEAQAALQRAREFGITLGRDQVGDPDPGMGGRPTARINAMRDAFQADKQRWPQLADELDRALIDGTKTFQQWNRPTGKVAHDSGDGATIYHCPFCGGGQVVAGSDGSVECGYCHTLFTVQVQPEHAAMPQTINGVPQDMPGMPGEVGGVPEGGAGPAPGVSPATDTGTDAFIPPDAFAPPPAAVGAVGAPPAPPVKAARHAKSFDGGEPEADAEACDHFEPGGLGDPQVCANCLWAIGAHDAKAGGPDGHGGFGPYVAFYLNGNGVALPRESYLRHLAITFADDPVGVIDQVRQERTNA